MNDKQPELPPIEKLTPTLDGQKHFSTLLDAATEKDGKWIVERLTTRVGWIPISRSSVIRRKKQIEAAPDKYRLMPRPAAMGPGIVSVLPSELWTKDDINPGMMLRNKGWEDTGWSQILGATQTGVVVALWGAAIATVTYAELAERWEWRTMITEWAPCRSYPYDVQKAEGERQFKKAEGMMASVLPSFQPMTCTVGKSKV